MKIKRYVAGTVQEAKDMIRKDLGESAVVLSTRKVPRGGLWGLLGRSNVEVTAALDEPLSNEAAVAISRASGEASGVVSGFDAPWEVLQKELAETKRMMQNLSKQLNETSVAAKYPSSISRISDRLKAADLHEELIRDLLQQVMDGLSARELEDESKVGRRLEQAMSNLVERYINRERLNGKIVCLVGPTGVGKTTTIAKLAAHAVLVDHKKIALVTFDTYRIAAVDQLKTYGEILGIPIEIVFTPSELRNALDRLQAYDTVFVDTVGRSHQNAMQISELKAFMDGIGMADVHLVLSTTTRYDIMLDVVRTYMLAKPTSLLFTKLDEASTYGPLLNLSVETGLPISYLTNGQNVPDDILSPKPSDLVSLILGAQ